MQSNYRSVSNPDQKILKLEKQEGIDGKVRDHNLEEKQGSSRSSHGGGEGKTSGGRSPVSPWGQSAKGLKTRRPKRSDKFIITRRKKRK